MNNIDLNLFKTFYCVALYNSFTKASEKLFISQPAVTQSIKKLEEQLNVELFKRTSNGIVLTKEGEKVRLKLFELIQKKANLLILDEPTNHIDIDTKEMLEEALSEYKGTLFFISHDRYFINKLAEKVINIEDECFHQYLGNYDYFKKQKTKKLLPPEPAKTGRRR